MNNTLHPNEIDFTGILSEDSKIKEKSINTFLENLPDNSQFLLNHKKAFREQLNRQGVLAYLEKCNLI